MELKTDPAFVLIKERYPHLAPRFTLFWGQPEFEEVITGLLLDTRNDKRKGFDKDAIAAILNLIRLHNIEFPRFADNNNYTDTDFKFR